MTGASLRHAGKTVDQLYNDGRKHGCILPPVDYISRILDRKLLFYPHTLRRTSLRTEQAAAVLSFSIYEEFEVSDLDRKTLRCQNHRRVV